MGLSIWVVYFLTVCACLLLYSVYSEDKSGFAIMFRIMAAIVTPLFIVAVFAFFGGLLRFLI